MRSNNNQTNERMHIVFATALDHDSKRMAEFSLSVAEKHAADITFFHITPAIVQGHPSARHTTSDAEKLLEDLLCTRPIKRCRPARESVSW